MRHRRVGRDDHARARHLRPPTEIEILTMEVDTGVEPSERSEQVGPDESDGARHVERVAHAIVLLLVELATLDVRDGIARLVGAHADRQQPLGVVPVDEFRPDDAGVRAERLFDHDLERVGLEADVVVAEQEERRALHGP